MLKYLVITVSLYASLYAVDLGVVDINAKEESPAIEQNAFESVFEEPEYYENTEHINSMPSQKRITKDEAMFIPGVQGDPIKAIQSFSGVTSVGDTSGELFIYGSKPEETITTLNHLPLGYLFHLGGLHSVIAPDAIDQIDAYMAGFDVTYGNAMGGVINVTPSYPDSELSGYGHVGLYDASAGINVPVTKDVSFYLGVRRSYFDLLLAAAGKATGTLDEDSNTSYTIDSRFSIMVLALRGVCVYPRSIRALNICGLNSSKAIFLGSPHSWSFSSGPTTITDRPE